MSSSTAETERAEGLEELQEDWIALAESTDHPFATWEWNSGWWRHFGDGRELRVFACRDEDGKVVAILPLYQAKIGPLKIVRFLGDGDLRSPICSAESRPIAASCMREVLRSKSVSGGLLLAERLPGGQEWPTLLGGRRLATHPDPVLPLKGVTWDDFLASRSRNFRQQVRRRERRLVEEHGLSFRLSSDPATLEDDISTLFRLHGMRWGDGSSGVFEGKRGDFHREFAAAAQRRGWLRLWIAEIAGEAVAAWYGWRFAGSEWYYQFGRDPRFDEFSLGFVLLAHTVREACQDGVDAYRFLDGAEAYKWRFASEDLTAESRALGVGARGHFGALGLSVAARMPSSIRRPMQRKVG